MYGPCLCKQRFNSSFNTSRILMGNVRLGFVYLYIVWIMKEELYVLDSLVVSIADSANVIAANNVVVYAETVCILLGGYVFVCQIVKWTFQSRGYWRLRLIRSVSQSHINLTSAIEDHLDSICQLLFISAMDVILFDSQGFWDYLRHEW